MASQYHERWIECTDTGIEIRGYYFPWGTKKIPYSSIRSIRRVEMTALRGKMRVWGTSNPHYWASLDPNRRKKSIGLILNLGRYVQPFITPDDPDKVEGLIKKGANLTTGDQGSEESPFI